MEFLASLGSILSVLVLVIIGLPIAGLVGYMGYNYRSHGAASKYEESMHSDNEPRTKLGWGLMITGGVIVTLILLTVLVNLFT